MSYGIRETNLRPVKRDTHSCRALCSKSILSIGILLTTTSLSFASSAHADEFIDSSVLTTPSLLGPENPDKIQLQAMLGSLTMNDSQSQASLGLAKLGASFTHQFTPVLSANFELYATFQEGTSSSLLPNQLAPGSSLSLVETAVELNPFSLLTLRAGILDQGKVVSSLLMDHNGFPATEEKLNLFSDGSSKIEVLAEQAIPTSSQLFTTLTPLASETPYFLTEKAQYSYSGDGLIEHSYLSAGYFYFSDLTPAIAQDSRFLGNSVAGLGSAAAQFTYYFSGLDTAIGTQLSLTEKLKLDLGGNYVFNVEAPTTQNTAYLAKAKVEVPISTVIVAPRFYAFHIESDAMPASYTNAILGNTNRQGYLAGVELSIPKSRLGFDGNWVSANPVTPATYTVDRDIIYFAMRYSYDLL